MSAFVIYYQDKRLCLYFEEDFVKGFKKGTIHVRKKEPALKLEVKKIQTVAEKTCSKCSEK